MPWFLYYSDLLIPVSVEGYTIEDVVENGAEVVRGFLGDVSAYCLYDDGKVIIIEYWSERGVSAKLIYAENPSKALFAYYNAEKTGHVRCKCTERASSKLTLPCTITDKIP
jgi:hypothetical protein